LCKIKVVCVQTAFDFFESCSSIPCSTPGTPLKRNEEAIAKNSLNHAEYRHSIKEDETPRNPTKHPANLYDMYDMYFKVTNDELADALLSIARDRKNRQNCVWDDLVTACSCPDGDNPSMHIAATYFLLAEELPKSWTGTHSLSSSFAVVPGNRS